MKLVNRKFCVAPMLDCTDRHARYLFRLISKQALLYTEMVTTGALLHGDKARFLDFDPSESPLALQLGGSDPAQMTKCAQLAQQWGYDEVNINVGCPSDRVQSGSFGACLMLQPELVADNVKQVQAVVDIPVTVKSRIGIDEHEPKKMLWHFVEMVANAGCQVFLIHGRKAWLKGLSPKQNRDVPPLDYPLVYQLKEDFPELEIIINGGIRSLAECQAHLAHVDGVMMGREAYSNPYVLSQVDNTLHDKTHSPSDRDAILADYMTYAGQQLALGVRPSQLFRPILGLYHGQARSRLWRRAISDNTHLPNANIDVLKHARRAMC